MDLKEKYTWEVWQQALFRILIDENRSEDAWYQMAEVFSDCGIRKQKLKEGWLA